MTLPPDIKVIDADTHMTEQHDLWTSRAPASLKDRVPQVARLDGMACWCVDGVILGRAGAGGVVDTEGNKGRSFEGLYEWEIDRAHVAGHDPVGARQAHGRARRLGAHHLPRSRRSRRARTREHRGGRGAARDLSRDLQRRERGDPGRVGQPVAADGAPPRVGHRRLRARGAARARTSACAASTSRRTRRTSARPTSRAPRGIRCGTRAARWACRCTSTSERASRR